MPNAIGDLLKSARILSGASGDRMLTYLIDMALAETAATQTRSHRSMTAGGSSLSIDQPLSALAR